jgi:hypothetical protein
VPAKPLSETAINRIASEDEEERTVSGSLKIAKQKHPDTATGSSNTGRTWRWTR